MQSDDSAGEGIPTAEQVVGQNVARLRKVWRMSQAELGEKIGSLTGKAWSRQSVWTAENGGRAFTAADLMLLAAVFEVHPSALLVIPQTIRRVQVGDVALERQRLQDPAASETAMTMAQLSDGLVELKLRLDDTLDAASQAQELGQSLTAAATDLRIHARRRDLGTTSSGGDE